jgi:uncharacterized OB-fold protein
MATTSYGKPLPTIGATNKPFWDAAKRHEIRVPRCMACGKLSYPISPHCLHCWSTEFEWARLSGRGKVNGFTVYHQAFHEAYRDDVPYNVVEVELDEGPRLVSNLVGIENDEIKVGMPVMAVFEDVTPEVTLIKFEPRS